MPDNTILNPGVNGDVARSIDRAGVKTQVVAIDLGGQAGPEKLLDGSGIPITAETLPLPTGAATQATLAALNVIAQAISDAVAALNGKATTINTGAIGGTVALDAPTLAALESITANTGGLTNAELRATALPVSGTFWQATQPVSFTWAGLTDAQLRASALPISAASLPLPADAATQTTLASVDGKLPALDGGRLPVVLPTGGSGLTDSELRAAPVSVEDATPPFMRVGFAEVGSGLVGKAAENLSLLQTGAGMSVNQSAGNLVITTGTTTNAETVIRSVGTFAGSLLARVKLILSQRIVNQVFRFELADQVGTALAYTINSATSVTVTFPATNPFTAANVGQSLRLSQLSSVGIPGRYAIASVAGLTVTFTVAGWPASGSGTLSLYGWNFIASEYSGVTATNVFFDAARRGWASGNTTATINTTASPGHVSQLGFDVFTAGYSDALVASNTGYQWATRASRVENLPDPDVVMYLFIVVQNGSTAPASTTTLTVGFIQVEDQGRHKVRIASSDPSGSHAMPVYLMGGLAVATQPVSGSVTSTLAASAVRAGFVAGAGIWFDDTAAALGASATFTGTSRDATVTATATAFANAATYAQEVRASAESDVTGTLWLEVSRDNTNWRRAKSVPTAAVTGGGFYAEIVHAPSWRYWRVGYTNGAGAQARLSVGSIATAL